MKDRVEMLDNFQTLVKSAITKTKKCQPELDQKRGDGCIPSAIFDHYDKTGGGQIYWVGSLKEIGYDYRVDHAYYIPPNSPNDFTALNQADSGYPQYPSYTFEELKIICKQPIDIDELRETIVITTEGYEF